MTLEIKYKAYLIHSLLSDIDDMIDKRTLTFEEFSKKYIEKNNLKCYNIPNSTFKEKDNGTI